jgi:hypothetical protein
MHQLSDSIVRKFTDVVSLNEWSVETDTGWEQLADVKQTEQYTRWELVLENGYSLQCADEHIVFTETMREVFVKDLQRGDSVMTDAGSQLVSSVTKTTIDEHMYDVGVDSVNHRFYSNGILSHNTTSAAGYLLWYAMFNSDKTILIAAHQYTGAQEIMNRIKYGYEMCPMWLKAGIDVYNVGNIDFENKSRIVARATTEKTGRGMSISLLYCDEMSFIRPTIAKEWWASISPTLATGGKCIITSTPSSDEDQFAQIWKDANHKFDSYGNPTKLGKNGFSPFFADWKSHPDRDQKWADEERSKIGDEKFRREHLCEFVIDSETLIDSVTLASLKSTEVTHKTGQVRWWEKPKKDHTYIVSLDPSVGTGGDPAAIQIIDASSFKQIGEWRHNKTSIPQQIKLLAEITEYIHDCTNQPDKIFYSVEINGIGEGALISLDEYGTENIRGIFISEPKKVGHVRKYRKGFTTSKTTKNAACSKLKSLIESRRLTICSDMLISELKTYVASGGSYAAIPGQHDDLISAFLLAIRIISVVQGFDGKISDNFADHDKKSPMPFIMSISRG